MAIIQPITLDLFHPETFSKITLQQGNMEDVKIAVTITQNSEYYQVPVNSTIYVKMLKPDGTYVINKCSLKDNIVYFTITNQMTAVATIQKRAQGKIVITNPQTGGTLKTVNFHFLIDEDAIPDKAIASTGEFTLLEDMILRVSDADAVVADATIATNRANDAALLADTNSLIATESANNANIARNEAIAATNKAIQATENTNIAIQNADTATYNANQAIVNINNSISKAELTITDANDATKRANNSADLADKATLNTNNIANTLEQETLKIFKNAVVAYSDLKIKYPSPENGWTVTVSNEAVSYRWNGTEWIDLGVISSVDTATNTTLGIVKGGRDVNIFSDGSISVPELANKSPIGHVHDDRYYTEQEANDKFEEKAKLSEGAYRDVSNVPTKDSAKLITSGAVYNAMGGKADTSHTHTKSQITDFPSAMPASDVSAWAKQATKPTYNASEVGALSVNGKAVSAANADYATSATSADKVDGLHFMVSSTAPTVDDKSIITFVI